MNIQKIIVISAFAFISHASYSMDGVLKKFTNLFHGNVQEIRASIDKTITDTSLTESKRHIKLSALYQELHDACVDSDNADIDSLKAYRSLANAHEEKAFVNSKKETEAREANAKKEFKIKQIEAKISRALSSGANKEQSLALIPDYKELMQLNPSNSDYRTKLQNLENMRLRAEIKEQIRDLSESNNKKTLLIAYGSLINTYSTEEKQAPYKIIAASLEQEIAQEEQMEEAKIQEALQRVEAERAAEERVQQEEAERLEALQLREAAEQARAKELKDHYTSLSSGIKDTETMPNISELNRKMILASMREERAKIGANLPDLAQQAQYDEKKVRELRYAALALAKAQRDTANEKKLFALLTQQ